MDNFKRKCVLVKENNSTAVRTNDFRYRNVIWFIRIFITHCVYTLARCLVENKSIRIIKTEILTTLFQ